MDGPEEVPQEKQELSENKDIKDNEKNCSEDLSKNAATELELNSGTESNDVKYFNGTDITKLTKRQLKKYNKRLKWDEKKKEKRAKERLRTKRKKIFAKLNNIDLGPSRKHLKQCKMSDSPCKTSIVIDLSFDDLMIDKVSDEYYRGFIIIICIPRIWERLLNKF